MFCRSQLEVAVDEVALQRLKAAEEQGRDRDHPKDIPPDPHRIPIEAPRARRSISVSDGSHSAPSHISCSLSPLGRTQRVQQIKYSATS